MVATCEISDLNSLWEMLKYCMSEDILHHLQLGQPCLQSSDIIYNLALIEIEDKVISLTHKDLTHWGLPTPNRDNVPYNRDIIRETGYNIDELRNFLESNEPQLNQEQQSIYYRILSDINTKKGGLFFLDAPGGTGKTFVTKLLNCYYLQ